MRGLGSLRVYSAAVQFGNRVERLLARSRVNSPIVEQLQRSARSVADNIAEGHGRGIGPDRLRFFRIARGSTQESLTQLRSLASMKHVKEHEFFPLFNLGRAIVKMLEQYERTNS